LLRKGANLLDYDLRGANLRDVDLHGANLCRADLRGANLRHVDLHGADLSAADLCDANLSDADLSFTDLSDADLRGVDLCDADLCGVDFSGADFRDANLDFSYLSLRCGGLKWRIDKRLACQIAYHLCSMQCDDPDFIKVRNLLIPFANQFHRVKECGKLEPLTEPAVSNTLDNN
jgi:hypothetical protein